MASSEQLGSLWEQAVADENWDLAAAYEEQLRENASAMSVGDSESSAITEQRAITSAELSWFGGLADHGSGPITGPRDIM